MHRVFVYGTLKRGFPNFASGMKRARFVGRFRTVDPYPLVVGERWSSPYLIPERGKGRQVLGEVFEVHDRGLESLDRMEGTHLRNGYRRMIVAVECRESGAAFQAWTYVMDRDKIEGGHSEPMEEYRLDSRYVISARRTTDL